MRTRAIVAHDPDFAFWNRVWERDIDAICCAVERIRRPVTSVRFVKLEAVDVNLSVNQVDNLPFRSYNTLYEDTACNFWVLKGNDIATFRGMHVVGDLLREDHVPRLNGVFHGSGWDLVGNKNEQAQ